MISGQKKIKPTSNKSFIVKNAQPIMNKFSELQVAAINFKHAKTGKSFIPSVPVNYTCPKQQKPGKSLIPRFMANKVENEKPSSLSHVNRIKHDNLKKDKSLELVKRRRSFIPRKVTKNVVTLPRSIQEKSQQTKPTSLLGKFGKSKIPVLTSTISTKKPKKASVMKRTTSHSRTCSICSPGILKENARMLRSKSDDQVRGCSPAIKESARISHSKSDDQVRGCSPAIKENARVSRFSSDDQVHVVTYNEIKTIKTQTHVLTFNIIKNDDVPSRIPTPISSKGSLIPVRSITNSLFKKRVSPMQPSVLASVKQEELESISTITTNSKYQIIAQDFNKKTNSLTWFSLKNKCTQLQKLVNKPEASISITHQVEVSTITSFIKPELSSVSLLYKAEKDLSGRHQIEENNEDESPSLFDNVLKSIVRFSKNLFSKMI